ncbi:MAG TPA: O-antigen ligase family protein [Kofleriaceae bacterium]
MEGAAERSRRAAAVIFGAGAIACVLAFVPGAQLLQYEQFALAKELVLPVVTLLPAAVLLWSARRITLSALEIALLLGLLLAIVSALAAETSAALTFRGLAVAFAAPTAFCVARAVGDDARLLLGLAVILGAVTVVGEMYGLVPSISMQGRAPGGTEGNRNFMAHALVVGLPALLVPYLRDGRRVIQRVSLAGVCLVIIAVVASRSRTAWLGLAVLVLTAAVVWWSSGVVRAERRRITVLAAAIVASVIVALLVPNRLAWTEQRPYWSTLASLADRDSGTGRGRMIQYRNTVSIVAAAPLLGVGAGNWSRAYPAYATPDDPSYRPNAFRPVNRLPNTDWLGIAAERGVPALLLHATFFALLAWGCWRRRREAAVWSGALLALLAAVAVMGILDAVLLRPTPALFAFALFGVAAPPFRSLVTLRVSRLAVIPVLVAAVLFTLDATRRLRAHELGHHRDIATLEAALRVDPTAYQLRATLVYRLYEEGRCDEMRDHAARVLDEYPHVPAVRALVETCGHPNRPVPR